MKKQIYFSTHLVGPPNNAKIQIATINKAVNL